ncbi:probable ATP-dependent RNA helicase DHX40, partial [Paramuricea clavata]
DILFGLIKRLFIAKSSKTTTRKHPLKIIVMSASLNHKKFSKFFGSCPVLEIPGRTFPVKNVYCNHIGKDSINTPNYLTKAVNKAMTIHTECPSGHILLFLTGQDEIERCCDQLFEKAENLDYRYDVCSHDVDAMLVLPLYGSMSTELQKRVFAPVEDGVRKVVVATNIAATSLTIEGIRYVIDCGFVKQLSFNPRTGLDSLNIVLISQSEALQRAGRAGRTTEGICYRLYTRDVYDDVMSAETAPEIQRTNLAKVVLYLKTMGIHDVIRFDYIDPPEEKMVMEAVKQLYILGALDRDGGITAIGHNMVLFPLSPCLSRILLASLEFNCVESILIIVAMLSVEDVFLRPGDRKKFSKASKVWAELAASAGGNNDFLTLLYVFEECFRSVEPAKWCREHFLHWRAVKTAANILEQLKSIMQRQ